MNVERASAASSLIDVLDRVLDKGIVIDAWVRVCLMGIDLLTIEERLGPPHRSTSLTPCSARTEASCELEQPVQRPLPLPRVQLAMDQRAMQSPNAAIAAAKAAPIRRTGASTPDRFVQDGCAVEPDCR